MSALRRALINIIKNDFIVNVTHTRDKGWRGKQGDREGVIKAFYFLSMSTEAGYEDGARTRRATIDLRSDRSVGMPLSSALRQGVIRLIERRRRRRSYYH